MNIELLDMTRLTILARHFIRTGEWASSLARNTSVDRRRFRLLADRDGAPFETGAAREWLAELSRRGASDFKLIVPDELDSYERLNRVNGIRCCIICFYDDRATSFNRLWTLNPVSGKFDVQLVEFPIDRMHEKPVFHDVSENMTTLLERLRALAADLRLSEFSFRFTAALNVLRGKPEGADVIRPVNSRLLHAASEAYVFGGKGSWTDVARRAAEDAGRREEFEFLTRELYRGIALSVMYAANED